MLTQEECRREILKRWRAHWREDREPNWNEKWEFYDLVRREAPQFVEFKAKGGDPWQVVQGWLIR